MTKLSLATSAFNIQSNDFDIEDAIKNWSLYTDEIVIATMQSNDDTYEILDSLASDTVKIVKTDFTKDDPEFDGKLKNAAHQAASHPVVIQNDLDERMGGNIQSWRNMANSLMNHGEIKGILIPSVDLWGSYYFASSINSKWYMTKKEGVYRGVVNFARKSNGTIDITKSDSCEPLGEDGFLIPSVDICQLNNLYPLDYCREHHPFVWHLGAVDLNRRKKLNEYWEPIWEARAGKEGRYTEKDIKTLEGKEVFEHNIQIDFL